MATLTLYKSNASYLDSYSYDNKNFNLTASSWYLLDNSQKIIYAILFGNNLTYDSYNNPVLGTVTLVSSLDKQGALQWTLSNIAIASNNTSSLESSLGKGNPFDYYIINNLLNSNDKIFGSSGNDIIYSSEGIDTIDGGLGNDWLNFSEFNFSIFSFDAILKVDLMNKTYSTTNNGITTIKGYINNIENITGSSENDVLIGDANNNIFDANNGDNIINGGAGVDTVTYKNDYNVIISLSTGIATARHYSFSDSTDTDTLSNIENIVGSVGDDVITGNSSNNQLSGGIGNDTLDGANGIDTVVFTNAYHAVVVNLSSNTASGEGTDKLSNFENIIGSSYNDFLTGSSIANSLIANAGDDSLNGSLGHDTLTGGLGKDFFIFNTAISSNKDNITDFSTVDDTIQLENSILTKLTVTGFLNTAYFKIGSMASDSNDYLIYNKTTGSLSYDGNGTGMAIQFAILGVNLALTNADFIII